LLAPVAGALLLIGVSCSKAPAPNPQTSGAASPAAAAPASAAASRVVGTIAGAPTGAPVIVVLDSKTPREYPAPSDTPVMDQVSQTFGPSLLFARTNAPTEFRNSDDTLHNVHVTHEDTREPQFNVAIPTGETYSFTFKRDGFYHVGCDIHPAMSAEIFASASPYVAVAGPDGSFQIDDVPPGVYVATVYAGDKRLQKEIDVTKGTTNVTVS
jgi:plastocyanin